MFGVGEAKVGRWTAEIWTGGKVIREDQCGTELGSSGSRGGEFRWIGGVMASSRE